METDEYQRLYFSELPELEAYMAKTGRARREGLAKARSLPPKRGLLLPGAPIVHMVGMGFPLDLVFINRRREVVKVIDGVRPGFRLKGSLRAWYCLELACGQARAFGIEPGVKLDWSAERPAGAS